MSAAGAATEAPVLREADRPWRAAADLVDRTRAGTGGALVVRGQAVGGKSALADRAEQYARELGVRVLRIQETAPVRRFGGLATLVADLAPVRKGLSALHDDLLGSVLDQPLTVRDGLALRGAVVTLLDATAAEAPLLLIADDADTLDAATLTVLEYAAHRFARSPLGLLATETSAAASQTTNTAAASCLPSLPSVLLPPLDVAAAARLLAERGVTLDEDRLRALVEATDGHGVALLELAPQAAAGEFDAPRRVPFPLTPRLAALFEPRLAGLNARARQALLLLAANQADDVTQVVGALRAAGSTTEALVPAETAGVVVDAPTYRFGHPLLRSAVYHAATEADRADAHRRLAAALAQRVRPEAVEQRAWHRACAEIPPDPAVAAELAGVGRLAWARRLLTPAREAFARAADFAPDPMARAALLTKAARCARLQGRAAEAAGWLTTARELLRGAAETREEWPETVVVPGEWPTSEPRVVGRVEGLRSIGLRVEAERGCLDRYHGDPADTFRRLAELARHPLIVGTPDAPALALDAVVAGILAQDPRGALAAAERARPELPEGHELHPVLRILTGYLKILLGEGAEGLRELRRGAAGPFEARVDTGIHGAVYAIRGFALLDRHAEAAALGYKAMRLAQGAEAAGLTAPLLVAIADADVRAGRWSAALGHALDGAATAERLGQPAVLAEGHAIAAWVTALRGEWKRARVHLDHAARGIAESGGRLVDARLVTLGAHAAAEDRANAAAEAEARRQEEAEAPAPKTRGRKPAATVDDAPRSGAAGPDPECGKTPDLTAAFISAGLEALRARGIVEEAYQPLHVTLIDTLLTAGEFAQARLRLAEAEQEPTASASVRAARARVAALLAEQDATPGPSGKAASGHQPRGAAGRSAGAVTAVAGSETGEASAPGARRTTQPAPDPREAYEHALSLLTPGCDPFEAARTHLAYGSWLRRVRRLDEARPHLDLAAAAFRRLGADGWAARVDAEVAAALRTVQEAATAERFSDREREIAHLVAAGMTDKQAAATLFLSPRTIEYHLRSLYRKLGIRTRTQLAAIVAEWGGR